jgi:hypothetical protein
MAAPRHLFIAFLASVLSALAAQAQSLQWQDSKSNAMAMALSQGKRVLLMAGRHTCGNCNYMQNVVCESLSPPIKSLIQSKFVPWFCVVDTSTEWYPYATGLGSFTTPLICCIDPHQPNVYLDRTTGIQEPQPFYARLLSRAVSAVAMQCDISQGRVSLALKNLLLGQTNRVERSVDLKNWATVSQFVATSNRTNWSESLTNSRPAAFYRIRGQ